MFLLVSVYCDTAQALVFLQVSVYYCDKAQALVFLLVSICYDTAHPVVFLLVSVCCDVTKLVDDSWLNVLGCRADTLGTSPKPSQGSRK